MDSADWNLPVAELAESFGACERASKVLATFATLVLLDLPLALKTLSLVSLGYFKGVQQASPLWNWVYDNEMPSSIAKKQCFGHYPFRTS